jgi:hypothetical protein
MSRGWMLGLLLVTAACLRPDSATVERLGRGGRADRLASVVLDDRALPEVRAQAASWLLTSGHAPLAMQTLRGVPEHRRGPVVAYLLHHYLPEVLARDPEPGRAAMLLVRPLGAPDSLARTDLLLLQALGDQLDRAGRRGVGRSALDLLRTVGAGRGEALLPLVARPGAPHGLLMELLASNPVLLDAALRIIGERSADPAFRQALLGRVQTAGSPAVVSRLLAMIESERDPAVGYRTYLVAVLVGGRALVVPALEAFPAHLRHSEPALSEHLVEGTLWLGPDNARELALQALRSRAALARYTAVLLLERVGQPDDARPLYRLRRDRARPGGLEAEPSIGTQAARVRDRLLRREKSPPVGPTSDGVQGLASRVQPE